LRKGAPVEVDHILGDFIERGVIAESHFRQSSSPATGTVCPS